MKYCQFNTVSVPKNKPTTKPKFTTTAKTVEADEPKKKVKKEEVK